MEEDKYTPYKNLPIEVHKKGRQYQTIGITRVPNQNGWGAFETVNCIRYIDNGDKLFVLMDSNGEPKRILKEQPDFY